MTDARAPGASAPAAVLWTQFAREALRRRLQDVGGLALRVPADPTALAGALSDAQVLVMPGSTYTRELAATLRAGAPRLRLLQLLTAGYEALESHGVPAGVTVANAGDAWSPSVAEHAMSLMLALVRGLPQALQAQSRRHWDRAAVARVAGTLRGRTLAIVGYGSIGREVAVRARAFGMRIVGVSRTMRADALIDEARGVADLHAVLAHADVVLVAVPSSARTRGLIGAAQLAACKPGALLVNVARGDIVDAHALREALASGRLGGAGLDVTDPEPLPADDPLWDAPNLIVTPHVSGAAGPAGEARLAEIVARNVGRFVRGDDVQYRVTIETDGAAR